MKKTEAEQQVTWEAMLDSIGRSNVKDYPPILMDDRYLYGDGRESDRMLSTHSLPTDARTKADRMLKYMRERYRRLVEDFNRIKAAVTGKGERVQSGELYHARELADKPDPVDALKWLADEAGLSAKWIELVERIRGHLPEVVREEEAKRVRIATDEAARRSQQRDEEMLRREVEAIELPTL